MTPRERYLKNRSATISKARKWAQEHPEERREIMRRWISRNAEKNKAYHRLRAQNRRLDNPEAVRKAYKKWYSTHYKAYMAKKNQDPKFRLLKNLRRRLNYFLRGADKSASTKSLIGCSLTELQSWLSGWFSPGMSWENYGSAWHVDHNRPCVMFDHSDPAQQHSCFHYLNLRPLWASDNLSKGHKYVM